jgi:hypothetical protein
LKHCKHISTKRRIWELHHSAKATAAGRLPDLAAEKVFALQKFERWLRQKR